MSSPNANDIAASLKDRIQSGEWNGSGKLPTERELAGSYQVARNTVRRAVDLLQAQGLVYRRMGSGTFLREEQPDELTAIVRRMEDASPADMMELRLLLEPSAAAFAATNASVSQLTAIENAHVKAVAASEMPEFEKWDTEFHQLIFECSRNDLLREINNVLNVLRNQSPWFAMKKRSFSEERRALYCSEHQKVMDALKNRLPDDAAEAMRAHLLTVQKNMLGRQE